MSRIEERKAKATVRLTDKNGQALANTQVKYSLKNHEFLFGCGAFDFVTYADLKTKADTEAKVLNFFEERTKKWLEVFNYATLPFYWGTFEPNEGAPQTENRMAAARHLKENGVTLKGHPLCWHTVCADWLLKYDNKTILEKQLNRIQREVSNFKGIIDKWDVINEVVIMPVFDRYDNAVTRLCNELGQVGIVKTMFDQCIKYNPGATLLINDFNMSPKYEDLIKRCLDGGVRIDAIGLQSHQHQGYWGLEKTEEVLSRFEKFGLPIHFTENTLVSGPLVPAYIEDLNDWHYNDDDSKPELEERQKNEMQEMLTNVFENHPLVKAFTIWDFTDGAWLNAPSGVLHRDNSEKPIYGMMKNLIKNQWHSAGTAQTDENGNLTIEGFKGVYQVEKLTGEKLPDVTIS